MRIINHLVLAGLIVAQLPTTIYAQLQPADVAKRACAATPVLKKATSKSGNNRARRILVLRRRTGKDRQDRAPRPPIDINSSTGPVGDSFEVVTVGVCTLPDDVNVVHNLTVGNDISLFGTLLFYDITGHHSGITAGNLSSGDTTTLVLPTTDGSSGNVLSTDGNGVLSWVGAPAPLGAWLTTGNAPATTAYLGTTNTQSINIVTNGTGNTRMSIDGTSGAITANTTLYAEGGIDRASATALNLGNTNATTINLGAGAASTINIGRTSGTTTTKLLYGGELQFFDTSSPTNFHAGIKAGTMAGNMKTLVLPTTDGISGDVLSTDGLGALSWVSAPAPLDSWLTAGNNFTGTTAYLGTTSDKAVNIITGGTGHVRMNIANETDGGAITANTTLYAEGGIDRASATALNLGNTNATTINLGAGAASTINIGRTSGTTTTKLLYGGELQFFDTSSPTNFHAGIKAGTMAGNMKTLVLPTTDGISGDVLSTDGLGALSWVSAPAPLDSWLTAGNNFTGTTAYLGTTSDKAVNIITGGTGHVRMNIANETDGGAITANTTLYAEGGIDRASATALNLGNTNATTINLGAGAASTINIGRTSGTTTTKLLYGGELQFFDTSSPTNFHAGIKAGTMAGNMKTLVLPTTDGISGDVLSTDGLGALSWVSAPAPLDSWLTAGNNFTGTTAYLGTTSDKAVNIITGGTGHVRMNIANETDGGAITANTTLYAEGGIDRASATALNLGNTNATTINLGAGAASTINIGRTSGTTTTKLLYGGELQFFDTSSPTNFHAGIKAGTMAGNMKTLVLPTTDGISGDVLSTDGLGALSWVSAPAPLDSWLTAGNNFTGTTAYLGTTSDKAVNIITGGTGHVRMNIANETDGGAITANTTLYAEGGIDRASATALNLGNTNATTINLGAGAASTINIGRTSGTTTTKLLYGGELQFFDTSSPTNFHAGIKAGTMAGNMKTLVLPTTDGISGDVLSTDGLGALSWVSAPAPLDSWLTAGNNFTGTTAYLGTTSDKAVNIITGGTGHVRMNIANETDGGAITANTTLYAEGGIDRASATALNLGNTNATTINLGAGAASTINIGRTSGTTTTKLLYGGELQFFDTSSPTNFHAGIKAGTMAGNMKTLVLPTTDGISGDVLSTDGLGALSWVSAPAPLDSWLTAGNNFTGTTAYLGTTSDKAVNIITGGTGHVRMNIANETDGGAITANTTLYAEGGIDRASATALNLGNTNATTINLGAGAASTINIGRTSGTTTTKLLYGGELQFFDTSSPTNFHAGIKAGTMAGNMKTLVLPTTDGISGDVLSTDGLGTLSWTSGTSNAWLTTGNALTGAGSLGSTTDQAVNFITGSGGPNTRMSISAAGVVDVTNGRIDAGGSLYIHKTGTNNFFAGAEAGVSTSGNNNTMIGYNAGYNVSSGTGNTAIGSEVMRSSGIGGPVTGSNNTVIGFQAGNILQSTSVDNTILGAMAGQNLAIGHRNIIIGKGAGINYNYETDNICIGHAGVNSEYYTIRIGTNGSGPGFQTRCYIAGISGITTTTTTADVVVSAAAQLGTIAETINMGTTSTTTGITIGNAASTTAVDGSTVNLGNTNATTINLGAGAASTINIGRTSGTTTTKLLYDGELQFFDTTGHHSGIKAGDLSSDDTTTLVLPTTNGSLGDVLSTNGSGTLSWTSGTSNAWLTTGNALTGAGSLGSTTDQAVNFITGTGGPNTRMSISATGVVDVTNGRIDADASRYIHKTGTGSMFAGSGSGNTAATDALRNTGLGAAALATANNNASCADNTAVGYNAGTAITTGANNTLIGSSAGDAITTGVDNTAVGYNALTSATVSSNTVVGSGAGQYITSGPFNTAVGYQALMSDGTNFMTGSNNTAVGYQAGKAMTVGSYNVALGWKALQLETTGHHSTALGFDALYNQNAGGGSVDMYNTAVGNAAGFNITTGTNNTLMGAFAGGALVATSNLTAVGSFALASNTTGTGNTAVGYYAGQNITSGYESTALGYEALLGDGTSKLTGQGNTAVGYRAGKAMTNATFNALFGHTAGDALTTGSANTLIGVGAGHLIAVGATNTAIGRGAMNAVTDGSSLNNNVAVGFNALAVVNDTGNLTAVGHEALTANTTGTANTAVGYQALKAITTNGSCTALGYQAGLLATGANNTLIGSTAGDAITSGADNTAVGYNTLGAVTTVSYLTAVGSGALAANTTGTGNTAVGYHAANALTSGYNNTAVGTTALEKETTGLRSTAIGISALGNQNAGGGNIWLDNTAVGDSAGLAITTGDLNVAIGTAALGGVTALTGNNNTAVGYTAGGTLQGAASHNTLIGSTAGDAITSGTDNTAVGYNTLGAVTTVSNLTAVGSGALAANTSGTANTAVGYQALTAETTGIGSTAVGYGALVSQNNTSSGNMYNTAVGYQAGTYITTGTQNTAVGVGALYSAAAPNQLTGSNNTALGYHAGYLAQTTAFQNTCIGSLSGAAITTGYYNTSLGYNTLSTGAGCTGNANVVIGTSAGSAITSGQYNTLIGNGAGGGITTTSENTFVGYLAGISNNQGANTAVGTAALSNNTIGYGNTAIGYRALIAETAGSNSTAVGWNALSSQSNTGDVNNTAIGYNAGSGITTGTNNICIGSGVGSSLTAQSNNIIIGPQKLNTSSSIQIGANQGIADCWIGGIYGVNYGPANAAVIIDNAGKLGTTPSSRRYKENIVSLTSEERFMQLNPVTFNYKSDETKSTEYGLIAEEVDELYPELVVHNKDGQVETIRYHVLDGIMIREIQENRNLIASLTKENTEYRSMLAEVLARVAALEALTKGR